MNFTEAYEPERAGRKIHATTEDGLVACGLAGYRYVDNTWTYFGKWEDTFPREKCKNCEKVAG